MVGMMVLVAWLYACLYLIEGFLAQRRLRFLAIVFPGVLVLYGVLGYTWPITSKTFSVVEAETASRYRKTIDAMVDDVAEDIEEAGFDSAMLYMLGMHPYVNFQTLQYEVSKKRMGNIAVTAKPFLSDANRHLEKVKDANYVMTFSDGIVALRTQLPFHNAQLQSTVINHIKESTDFCLLASYPIADAGHVSIFKNFGSLPPWSPLTSIEGLGSLEGPYPDRGLPTIRWGLWPTSAFVIDDISEGGSLKIEARSLFEDHPFFPVNFLEFRYVLCQVPVFLSPTGRAILCPAQ